MSNTISLCGIDCSLCNFKNTCSGCAATGGKPFGGECVIAKCCLDKRYEYCKNCTDSSCDLEDQLISEFNALGIEDLEEVTSLNSIKSSLLNLEFTLLGGQKIKFWAGNRIYLGNQIYKKNSNRFYGLTADENYLLVCEYGDGGFDAEIVAYKK